MGDRNIKKETKKPKKSAKSPLDTGASSASRPIMTQPELIKKAKKTK